MVNYAAIAVPLTNLLRHESFCWNPKTTKVFTSLKSTMMDTRLLHLPDFSKEFIIEIDALKLV